MKLLYPMFMLCAAATSLNAYQVVARSPSGELAVVNVESEENFLDVIADLKSNYGHDKEFIVDFMEKPAIAAKSIAKKATDSKNYGKSVSSSEKSDIRYIITTLGFSSLVKIAQSKSSLKKAGKRVDNIHPLRFLLTIFSDEEMKAGIYSMRNRGWIWGEFIGGVKDSCEEVSSANNLGLNLVADFASRLGVDPNILYPSVINHQWEQMVNILIDTIPRSTNANHYQQY